MKISKSIIDEAIHNCAQEMATYYGAQPFKKPIKQKTEEYYNGKIVSISYYDIYEHELEDVLYVASKMFDCTIIFKEDDCLAKVIRKQDGCLKSFVTTYYKNKED